MYTYLNSVVYQSFRDLSYSYLAADNSTDIPCHCLENKFVLVIAFHDKFCRSISVSSFLPTERETK